MHVVEIALIQNQFFPFLGESETFFPVPKNKNLEEWFEYGKS